MAEKNQKEETSSQPKVLQDSDVAAIRENTAKMLAQQPKRSVKLRKDANPKAPNYETVQVNGYTFMIQKGVEVEVPQTVYEILVEAGLY